MRLLIPVTAFVVIAASSLRGDEKRAPRPEFPASQTRGVFFPDLSDGLRGTRPTLESLRRAAEKPAMPESGTKPAARKQQEAAEGWSKLAAATSIEDEVKRLRLHFDSVVTTPGAFSSGGYQDARVDLSVLAMLFAVINEYDGDVRWKGEAAKARDLISRTAFNCKAGSTQVYNEAKLRKQDLQDLVSGGGLSGRPAEPENDWAMIVDRSPLMRYAESTLDRLEGNSRNQSSIEDGVDAIRRDADMLAILGEVLSREGMVGADDPDYRAFAQAMTGAATSVTDAAARQDTEAVRQSVGQIGQSCIDCHDQYR